jgi:hypothetical protein
MSKHKPHVRPHGQLRNSQVITTFGPGSLLDLPHHSVLVGGLDHWNGRGEEIHEPRLIEKLKRLLSQPALKLYGPPPDADDPLAPPTWITAWQFPEWFVTQNVTETEDKQSRRRRLLHREGLTGGKYYGDDRKYHPVVPIRFVRACPRGHIGEIDWHRFVHQKNSECKVRRLWLLERGTSGDLSELSVRCECGESRSLVSATNPGALGHCDGRQLWLGPAERETCAEQNRLLVRSASNAYFPRVMSVISLPDKNESLEKAVTQAWTYLEAVESAEEVKYERKKHAVKVALDGFTDEEVWKEAQARRGLGGETAVKSVKQAEFEVLTAAKEEIGTDTPDGRDFFARTLPKKYWDRPWTGAVERVVLVHRLREVTAQVGFTRFEANTPNTQGELEMGVSSAPLARDRSWLPAVENRGEGVFVQFRKEAIKDWLELPAVKERDKTLRGGYAAWKAAHPHSTREYPELPYFLLHTISHLLMTSMSLECGYPASSIRERVYALESGYGILLYTGSPDAEGTLGGLVEAGRQIARHLRSALEMCRLCSNDPVCAQHDPTNVHEVRFLHGAACHGCLFIAETSCEQYNDFLDRALVMPTVDDLGAEFFHLEGV